jgi:hypothetical protein
MCDPIGMKPTNKSRSRGRASKAFRRVSGDTQVLSDSIAAILASLFLQARAKQQPCLERWKKVSYRLGPLLPQSLLIVSIQQQGELDSVLRCVEDEFSDASQRDKLDTATQYFMMFTVDWIGGTYEILRLLRERKLLDGSELQSLLREFELLRMPLEKHEIAKDRNLRQPLELTRFPPTNAPSDFFTYDQTSPTKTHIMPSVLSPRGSITWQAIDAAKNTSCWIERRSLSDKILELWGA